MRLLWLFSLFLIGCNKTPTDVILGQDVCVRCKMTIADERFAAEIINTNGKVFKFDSIECMVAQQTEITNIHSMWVKDFANPSGWIDARRAVFLRSETLPSPMGGFLSAWAEESAASAARERYAGILRTLDQLKTGDPQ